MVFVEMIPSIIVKARGRKCRYYFITAPLRNHGITRVFCAAAVSIIERDRPTRGGIVRPVDGRARSSALGDCPHDHRKT